MRLEIYQGDCIEVLKTIADESIDAVVCDPPYCSVGQASSWVNVRGLSLPNEVQFFEAWAREILAEMLRVCRPTGAIWLTSDLDGLVAWKSAAARLGCKFKHGVWDKDRIGMGHILRNSHEFFCVIWRKGFKRFTASERDVWRHAWCPGMRGTDHQAEKPWELLARAIRLVTPPGGTVLDPFAGSGTTGLAAQAEGFGAVLIEREPEYVEIALARNAHLAVCKAIAGWGRGKG